MRKPDALEVGLRIGCGGLFGLGVGLWMCFDSLDLDDSELVAVVAASVLICAGLAYRYGDDFWRRAFGRFW
jgi:hypothetical protein